MTKKEGFALASNQNPATDENAPTEEPSRRKPETTAPVTEPSTDPTVHAPASGNPLQAPPSATAPPIGQLPGDVPPGNPFASAPVNDPALPGQQPPIQNPPPVGQPENNNFENPFFDNNRVNNDRKNKNNDNNKDKNNKNKNAKNKNPKNKQQQQPPQIPPFQPPQPPEPTKIPEFVEVEMPQVLPYPPFTPLLAILEESMQPVNLDILRVGLAAIQQSVPQLTSSEAWLSQMGAIARQGQEFREEILTSFSVSLGYAIRPPARQPASPSLAGTNLAPPFSTNFNSFQVPPAFPEGIPRTGVRGLSPHQPSGRRETTVSPQTH